MIGAATWNPGRYLAFAGERIRPAIDLLAQVPLQAPKAIADLGCGPGNSTALLAQRWPAAALLGVDSSETMLAEARDSDLKADWLCCDLATWQPTGHIDLLFSNATLQWLDNHERLFPRLLEAVVPSGCLAIQMPRNFSHPSHLVLAETVANGPWSDTLSGTLRGQPVAEPAQYYDLLAPLSATLEIWETTYNHVLTGDDPVLEWMRGTALRPVLTALPADQHGAFEAALAERLRHIYPQRDDGKTLLPFHRLFIVALAKG